FYIKVGWVTGEVVESPESYTLLNYDDLSGFKDIERSPEGNLPSDPWDFGRWGVDAASGRSFWRVVLVGNGGSWGRVLFSRAANCNL
ncbi:MAG: hypothetical protein ACRDEA_11945, partial [Microcystaceae cyanobacterium]